MTGRERILAKLRHNRAASPGASPGPEPIAPAHAREPDPQMLIDALQGAHAEVLQMADDDWPDHLATLADQRGWRHWWVGNDHAGQRWQSHPGGHSAVLLNDWRSQRQDLFNRADASLTQAQAAITETGTLVVESGPQSPRTLSLVPPVHVVIIYRDTLVPTLEDALKRYGERQLPANIILISGPSKTADIQQTLAYGAHGPRELIVYLCGE